MKLKYMIAITGSIGTGKSLVCKILKDKGYEVIDVDKVSHEILNDSSCEIESLFGSDFLDKDGKPDRKKLAKLIFNDKEAKERLESLLHAKIFDKVVLKAKILESKGKLYFLDIPLLYESKNRYNPAYVCVVYTPKDVEIKRVMQRDGVDEVEALKKIDAQIDIEIKKIEADFVIDNSKDISYLKQEVESFLQKLKEKYMEVAKYSANGNDFVIFDTQKEIDRSTLAIQLCDRHEGVGADGLIVIIPSEDKNKYDFKWQFYNSDGSVADMCGNGSRACAHYAYSNGLASKKMSFLTGAGVIQAEIHEGDMVEIKLTKPKEVEKAFTENGYNWHYYNTGVPHLVAIVDSLDEFSLDVAKKMRNQYNANVNFLLIRDEALYVRTYERGVEAETLACGTGMAACFCVANKLDGSLEKVKVVPKNRDEVFFRFEKDDIFFKGKVKHVFTACIKKGLMDEIGF